MVKKMLDKRQILDTIKRSQRKLLDQVHKVTSDERVRKTTNLACDYGKKLANDLMKELQKQGKITAKETKKLLKEINKKSEDKKEELQQTINKDSQTALKTIKSVIVNSLALTKKIVIEKSKSVKKK